MRRLYQVASLAFLAVGIAAILGSRDFEYYTPTGPGPGFFPFWLGLALALISAVWFGQSTFQPVRPMPEDFMPDRAGLIKVLSVILAMVVTAAALTLIGFQLSGFFFLLFVIWRVGRRSLPLAFVLAVVGSVGVNHIFNEWLDVPLPVASIPFLESLGL